MFEKILKEVILPNEGGYVNHPNDRGGATNFGITQATYDKYVKNKYSNRFNVFSGDIKNISLQEVTDIYKSFWVKARCDLLWDYVPALTVHHFDFVVNAGYERKGTDAAEILQRTISKYIPTVEDGYVGPKTLGNIIQYVRNNPLSADRILSFDYATYRINYYESIVTKNETQRIFLKGWKNRVMKVDKWINNNILDPANP